MRAFIVTSLVLCIGAALGYAAYPLTHASADATHPLPGVSAREAVDLNLTPEQLDRLAARIAPAVARQLAASSPGSPGTPRGAPPKSEAEQAKAFDDATQIVDQMIASRRVTSQGLMEARQVLADSGQEDRMFEISARVSAAVNRGELTLEQAGLRATH